MSDIDLGRIFNIAADFNHIAHPLELTEQERLGEEPSFWDRFGGIVLLILMTPLIVPTCLYLYWANRKVEQIDAMKGEGVGADDKGAKNTAHVGGKFFNSGPQRSGEEDVQGDAPPKEDKNAAPLNQKGAPPPKNQIETTATTSITALRLEEGLSGFIRIDLTIDPVTIGNSATWGQLVSDSEAGLKVVPLAIQKHFQRFAQEDGKPFPLDPKDKLVPCDIFNPTDALLKTEMWTSEALLYLPSAFLLGKKQGDTIRFQFDGKLIEVEVNQVKPKELKLTSKEIAQKAFHVLKTKDSYELDSFENIVATKAKATKFGVAGISEWSYTHVEQPTRYQLAPKSPDDGNVAYTLQLAKPRMLDFKHLSAASGGGMGAKYDYSLDPFVYSPQMTLKLEVTKDNALLMKFECALSEQGNPSNLPLPPVSESVEIFIKESSLIIMRGTQQEKIFYHVHPPFVKTYSEEQWSQMLQNGNATFQHGILTLELPLPKVE